MNNYCVYKHTTPSGKVYIGITSKPVEKRWLNGRGYARNEHFWNAIKKYGWENIEHRVLVSGLSKEEASEVEKMYIAYSITSHSANTPRQPSRYFPSADAAFGCSFLSIRTSSQQNAANSTAKISTYSNRSHLSAMRTAVPRIILSDFVLAFAA